MPPFGLALRKTKHATRVLPSSRFETAQSRGRVWRGGRMTLPASRVAETPIKVLHRDFGHVPVALGLFDDPHHPHSATA